MKNFVGVCLALEFVLLIVQGVGRWLVASGDPAACVWLMGATVLWPALRITLHRGPVRGLLVALVLVFWVPCVFVATNPGARCIHGALVAASSAQTVVTFNVLLLAACLVVHFVARATTRAPVEVR